MTPDKLLNHIRCLAERIGPALVTEDGELHTVELAEKVAQSDETIKKYDRLVLSIVKNMEDDIIEREIESRRAREERRRYEQSHQPQWKPKK